MIAILITHCGCMRQMQIKTPLKYIVLPLVKADFSIYCCEKKENYKGISVDKRIFEIQCPFHYYSDYFIYKEVDE